MQATTLYLHASDLEIANGNSSDITVDAYAELAIDINITGNQGSSPTIQYFLDRKGADNVYYPIWQSTSQTASSAQVSTSVGPGLAYNQALGSKVKFRWVIGGTSTPGFTFSASLQGR
jgi:hypothetical protein